MEDPKLKELQQDLGMSDEEFADFLANSPSKEGDDSEQLESDDTESQDESQDENLEDETVSSSDEFEMAGEMAEQSSPQYKSQMERRQEKMKKQVEERLAKKAEKSLMKRREALKKAANKFRRKREKIRNQPLSPTAIKNYDSEVEVREITDLEKPGNPLKITPDVEKMLFPYFISGASIRSIHQQFGRKYDFALQTLYAARDFYKWEQRRTAIIRVARSTSDLEMAERFKDYMAFFDDLLSEAMIRFKMNSDSGQNTNPFNTLKVTNVKDMKELIEMISQLKNGGVKKSEIELNGTAPKLSNNKRAKLLEVLAEDDE